MDPQDIRTLEILEKLDKRKAPSQRHLARELNISLGLGHDKILITESSPANNFYEMLPAKGVALEKVVKVV